MNKFAVTLTAALIGVVGSVTIAAAAENGTKENRQQIAVSEGFQAPLFMLPRLQDAAPRQVASDNATASHNTTEASLLRGNARDHNPHWGPAEDATD